MPNSGTTRFLSALNPHIPSLFSFDLGIYDMPLSVRVCILRFSCLLNKGYPAPLRAFCDYSLLPGLLIAMGLIHSADCTFVRIDFFGPPLISRKCYD